MVGPVPRHGGGGPTFTASCPSGPRAFVPPPDGRTAGPTFGGRRLKQLSLHQGGRSGQGTAPAGGKPGPRLEPARPGREVPRVNQAKTPAEDCRLWAITQRRREPRLLGEDPTARGLEGDQRGGVSSCRAKRLDSGRMAIRAAVHTSMRDGDRSRGSASRVTGPRSTVDFRDPATRARARLSFTPQYPPGPFVLRAPALRF